MDFEPSKLPCLRDVGNDHGLPFVLTSFETWVDRPLQSWLNNCSDQEKKCGELRQVATLYHQEAQRIYADSPESLSIMLLIIMELWVACDKRVCQMEDLVHTYDTLIPWQLLQNLVLKSVRQMERLQRVEVYCQTREREASRTNPSIFHACGASNSFASNHYRKYGRLHALRASIVTWAACERQKKREEFRGLKAEFDRLMKRSNEISCDPDMQVDRLTGKTSWSHANCTRCRYRGAANALTIYVHEWPLPTDELQAESIIFELAIPSSFSEWRDFTMSIRMEVLLLKYVHGENAQTS
jgi:hypothetical protein